MDWLLPRYTTLGREPVSPSATIEKRIDVVGE